jgi:hypothetical protein
LNFRTMPTETTSEGGAGPREHPRLRRRYLGAFTAMRRGHSIGDANRLMQLSGRAKENGERYAQMTVENAAGVNSQRRRSRT